MKISKLIPAALTLMAASMLSHASPETEALAQKLVKSMPGLTIDSLTPSAIPGLYEVVSGGDVAYVTQDGVHMIQGTMFNVPARKNLSEKTLSAQRAKALQELDPASLIVYKATGAEKQVITVFTDPSCPYCHRLHDEIPKLNELGVTVRYALYARSGEGALTSRQLSEVLCAEDKKTALVRFFANPSLNASGADCAQAAGLERIARAATQVGLKGTPHIVTNTGYASSGYMPAPELLRAIQQGS